MLFRDIQHLFLQFRRALAGIHLEEGLPAALRVQHGCDLALLRLPDKDDRLERIADLAVVDEMPAPIVEAGNVPAKLPAAVEQEHLAQEIAYPPVVVFVSIPSFGQFHSVSSINLSFNPSHRQTG